MTAPSVLWARALALAAHEGLTSAEIAGRLGVQVEQVEFWLRRPVERLSFPPRSCEGCGELFVPCGAHQRYCCPEHRPRRSQRRCAYCRQPFTAHAEGEAYCCPPHERARAATEREHDRGVGCPRAGAGV